MISIAIDGPSGVGKSTLAKELASKLQFVYVDTGALYRAIGLYVLNQNKNTEIEQEVVPLLSEITVEIKFVDGTQRVFLNSEDVSDAIREHRVSKAASDVSAFPKVREFLLSLQRDIATKNNVIMDGRDIGTVILPNADLKIFLTAQPEERAKRRQLQLAEKGEQVEFETVLADIKQRDFNDTNRATAPLKQADDAVLIDSTEYSFEYTLDKLYGLIKEKCNELL